ncbi:MAG: alpha-glucan family phosphorylase [Bacteroidales bacterium]|nr:alpha-glucan family phosphorylase [Bacteroidales bacterium]
MSENTIKPNVIFETSWEVCNKVGGIYTVLSSKYQQVSKGYDDRYIFIGPDVWKETRENPDFIEDKSIYRSWTIQAEKEGIRIRIGRWNIPGKPVAVLVDFTPFFTEKDKIFAGFWETYKLDSLTGGWDYVEPALFGYAAGKVIESFYDFYISQPDAVIAQFHEWMTGSGILYLKENAPKIGTVFTTHATILGRSMAGNNIPLYSKIAEVNPSEIARQLGVVSKYSLELNASLHADCFTTVSEITAKECKYFLKREPDLITPNGFSDSFAPAENKRKETRDKSRKIILDVAQALMNQKLDDDTLLVLTSGRYEFRNKGIDAFIDALSKINSEKKAGKTILAIIAVPANQSGPNRDLLKRMDNTDFKKAITNEYLTHNLYDKFNDPVISRILENNLNNGSGSKVKIMFVPVYLNGSDGIFNLEYYHFLSAFDLTIFPSFYEPWGYTPLESIAFRIPTLTTTLAGFGAWVKAKMKVDHKSVIVVDRTEENYSSFTSDIADSIRHFAEIDAKVTEKASQEAFKLSEKFQWNLLASAYDEAYSISCALADKRSDIVQRKALVEYVFPTNGVADKPEWKKFYVRTLIPDELDPLKELSFNLWWTWSYRAQDLFRSIDEELWESTSNNPVALLNRLSYEQLQELKSDAEFMSGMNSVYREFKDYLSVPKEKPEESIGYFSMEYGLHESIKTYSGGLGILAGDYLKEASDSNKNITGVGLMYRYGYFEQSISLFGDQIAENQPQKYTDLPLLPVRDQDEKWVMVSLALPGRTLFAKVWELKIGRVSLFLLDTDIEENNMEDREITHSLYGGDWFNRFKQELLLGVGGVRLLNTLNIKPALYHLNEGHAAFAGVERLRHMVENLGMEFSVALEIVRASSLFTTHTPVPAGHDTFSEDIIRTYIPHYPDRLNISWTEFINLGKYKKGDPTEKFSMSILAANLSQQINGVSKIHGRVTRDMFRNLYPGYYPEELHIGYVTNGIHFNTWTAPNFVSFYETKLGKNLHDRETWKKINTISDAVLWRQRVKAKNELVAYLKKKYVGDLEKRQESPQTIYKSTEGIIENALYVGFARRFATYKRAHLLFTDTKKLADLLNDPERPMRFVFAGKAHPNDKPGQDLIKKIIEISKQPDFIGKIFFLENYDMGVARKLVSGVDIWLNTPTRPLEASGTSGEKAIMNGVLNLSVLDGWWAEGYVKNAGWAVAEAKTYANQAFQDELDADIIYRFFEEEILDVYFEKNKQGVSHKWMAMVKKNLVEIAPRFTMKRMIDDYFDKFYSKLFLQSAKVKADNYKLAREIKDWKNHIVDKWAGVEVISLRLPDTTNKPLSLGENFDVELKINTNQIEPKYLGVDLVLGQKVLDEVREIIKLESLDLRETINGDAIYTCTLNLTESGVFDFAFRIFPKHEDLPHRQDFPLVKWI